jgi:hypothetical protein
MYGGLLRRRFCTAIKASLPPLRVNSFALTPDQAIECWRGWTKNHFWAPVGSLQQISQLGVWLPFFTYDVTATSTFSAEVRGSGSEAWKEIKSQPTAFNYNGNLKELQVYANYSQKYDHVQVVKQSVQGAKLFSELDPSEVKGMEFERFEMHRSIARTTAFATVKSWEEHRGQEILRAQFGEFRKFTHALQLDFTNQPVFFPCYIVDFLRLGRAFRSVVNGVTGEVWGQKHYSVLKVGVTAAPLNLWLGTSYGLGGSLVGAASAVGMGFAAGFFPFYRQYLREVRRLSEKAQNDAFEVKSQHAQEAAYNLRYTPHAPAKGHQVKSHYRLLGLESTAQLNEVQRAFRTQSFLWHPDVHAGKKSEDHAHTMYRDIIAAYQVLRCPNKRRIYDTSDSP